MKKPSKKKQIKLLKRALDDSNDTVNNLRIELSITHKQLLINFKQWEVDNDIKNLSIPNLVDFYLAEEELKH